MVHSPLRASLHPNAIIRPLFTAVCVVCIGLLPTSFADAQIPSRAQLLDGRFTNVYTVRDLLVGFQQRHDIDGESAARLIENELRTTVGGAVTFRWNQQNLVVLAKPAQHDKLVEAFDKIRSAMFQDVEVSVCLAHIDAKTIDTTPVKWRVVRAATTTKKNPAPVNSAVIETSTTQSVRYAVLDPKRSAVVEREFKDSPGFELLGRPRLRMFGGNTASAKSTSQRPFVVAVQDGIPQVEAYNVGWELSISPQIRGDKVIITGQWLQSEILSVSTIALDASQHVQMPVVQNRAMRWTYEIPIGSTLILAGQRRPSDPNKNKTGDPELASVDGEPPAKLAAIQSGLIESVAMIRVVRAPSKAGKSLRLSGHSKDLQLSIATRSAPPRQVPVPAPWQRVEEEEEAEIAEADALATVSNQQSEPNVLSNDPPSVPDWHAVRRAAYQRSQTTKDENQKLPPSEAVADPSNELLSAPSSPTTSKRVPASWLDLRIVREVRHYGLGDQHEPLDELASLLESAAEKVRRDIQVTASPKTNGLVVEATAHDHAFIAAILKDLEDANKVRVEAAVVEITNDQRLQLGPSGRRVLNDKSLSKLFAQPLSFKNAERAIPIGENQSVDAVLDHRLDGGVYPVIVRRDMPYAELPNIPCLLAKGQNMVICTGRPARAVIFRIVDKEDDGAEAAKAEQSARRSPQRDTKERTTPAVPF